VMRPGDRFIICSGGVGRSLGDRRLLDLADNSVTPEEAAERVVTAAANADPLENMIVVLLEVEEG